MLRVQTDLTGPWKAPRVPPSFAEALNEAIVEKAPWLGNVERRYDLSM